MTSDEDLNAEFWAWWSSLNDYQKSQLAGV